MQKGLNIEVTSSQYDYLYEVLMEAYSNDVAEQKDWDVQTFDNLVDNVMNAKSTYLSDSTRGSLSDNSCILNFRGDYPVIPIHLILFLLL